MTHHWTCQRSSSGVRCAHRNPARKRLCESCGKARPTRKVVAHRQVLAVTPYEVCVERFGEVCGICGTKPKPGRKLHRDHEHRGNGRIRGLLCFRCNAALRSYMTVEWLRKALAYLERFIQREMA